MPHKCHKFALLCYNVLGKRERGKMLKKELEKHPIKNYFVGELCISFSPNVLKDGATQEEINETNKIDSIINNGAICLNTSFGYDENNRPCTRFLALFFYDGNRYECLNYEYSRLNAESDYYKNLVPLHNCLPKIDYNMPSEIDEKEAKILFDTLFKRTRFRTPASLNESNIRFSPYDYYAGTLNIYTGYKENGRHELANLAQERMLIANGCKSKKEIEINDDRKVHIYREYICLFLKQQKGKLLNLCNNQYYEFGILRNDFAPMGSVPIKKSYYELMMPYNSYMASINKKSYIYGDASTRKVLTKFNKI
jgi:hypothetical protein